MRYSPKIKGTERILHATVKTVTGYCVLGKSHADCFWAGRNMGMEMSKLESDQGFITNKGRYVDRKLAATIAKRAKQLDETDIRRPANKITYLLSEDIWYQRERFEYSQTRGYFEVKKCK